MLTIRFSSVCYLIDYIRIVSALCSCKQVEKQHAVTEYKTINRMHTHKKTGLGLYRHLRLLICVVPLAYAN